MAGILDSLRLIDGPALASRVTMRRAVEAVQQVLRDGFDPDDDPARTIVDVRHGQLLIMPSEIGGYAGQKLATVAPANPERGLPRIQAMHVVLDGRTLAPIALLDGSELTALRTPAVSAAVLDLVAPADAASLVVFGTGPQGVRHVEAVRAVRPIERVRFVGRDRARAVRAVAAAATGGIDVGVGSADDVADADIVVCATTAREPLLDAALVRDRAAVVAVGSHEPDARELPADLLGRAHVIVESDRVALAEAGDIVLAVAEGRLEPASLVPMAALFSGSAELHPDRPRVLKTCGMGWQDLVVAGLAIDDDGEGAG